MSATKNQMFPEEISLYIDIFCLQNNRYDREIMSRFPNVSIWEM